MFDIFGFANQALKNNQNCGKGMSDGLRQNCINAIQNRDEKSGEELALNFCKTFGVSKEEAIEQASNFFGIKL